MPNANMFEITGCLRDLAIHFEAHPSSRMSELYRERLRRVTRKLEESVETTDTYYLAWMKETAEDKMAWKEVATLVRRAQQRLRRIGALNYPDRKILYWDEEILGDHAAEMVGYLEQHQGDLDFAADTITAINRALEAAQGDTRETEGALKNYKRFISFRRDALATAIGLIDEIRRAMRREYGKTHPDYQAIDWPYAIASDEGVLF